MRNKLLLADDSITIQKVVELILAEEGFDIKAVTNGEEALSIIPSFKPDVILADIEMPKMNGYQLCEKIKKDPATKHIPVILLTGAFEPIDEELAKHVNADDYLVKPFESQELLSKINAVLAESTILGEKEIEEVFEAQPVTAESTGTEDLWESEVFGPEQVSVVEEEQAVDASTEEILLVEEEAKAEETKMVEEAILAEEEIQRVKEITIPSSEELKRIFEDKVNEQIQQLCSSIDLKESFLNALIPSIKDSVEKILWEVAPDLVERMLKEMLKGTLESLSKEVEKVIWETVPDLAETIINKEIERIRSEF